MKERMISRGDLFYYDFGERVGSVQSGERPVLVVQADDYNKNARSAYSVMNVRRSVRPKHCIKKWSWRYSCNGKVEFCTYTKNKRYNLECRL